MPNVTPEIPGPAARGPEASRASLKGSREDLASSTAVLPDVTHDIIGHRLDEKNTPGILKGESVDPSLPTAAELLTALRSGDPAAIEGAGKIITEEVRRIRPDEPAGDKPGVTSKESEAAFEKARKTGKLGSLEVREDVDDPNVLHFKDSSGNEARASHKASQPIEAVGQINLADIGDDLGALLAGVEVTPPVAGGGNGEPPNGRIETAEWGKSPEDLPSIEQIERLTSMNDVIEVMWKWSALADRDPLSMWGDGNEEKMDAAMKKFGEMAELSQFDMSGGALVGFYQEIQRLRALTEPDIDIEVVEAFDALEGERNAVGGRLASAIKNKENLSRQATLENEKNALEAQLKSDIPEADRIFAEARLEAVNNQINSVDSELKDITETPQQVEARILGLEARKTVLEQQRGEARFEALVNATDYETKSIRLEELEADLAGINQLEKHREEEGKIDEKIQNAREAIARAESRSVSDINDENRNDVSGFKQIITVLERDKQRLPVNREIKQLEEQAEAAQKKIDNLNLRLGEIDKDKNMSALDKALTREQFQIFIDDETQIRDRARKGVVSANEALAGPIPAEYKANIEREIAELKTELQFNEEYPTGPFANHIMLDREYKNYSDQWLVVLEKAGIAVPEAADDPPDVEQEGRETIRELKEAISAYSVAWTFGQEAKPEVIMRDLMRVEMADFDALSQQLPPTTSVLEYVLRNVVRTDEGREMVGHILSQVNEEDRPEFDLQGKIREIVSLYVEGVNFNAINSEADIKRVQINRNQIKERAREEIRESESEIGVYIREAKEAGLLDEELKEPAKKEDGSHDLGTLDNLYEVLKQDLSPHPAGYTRQIAAVNYANVRRVYAEEVEKSLDPKLMKEMQDKLWKEKKDRDPAFTDDNRERFDGLIPFLRHRFYVQAVDYIEGYKKHKRFPDELPNRHLSDGEWDLRKAERGFRERKGQSYWESSGSGYYYVNAQTLEEFELAVESFVRGHLRTAVKKDPNAIFQEREKFVIALGEAASKTGLSEQVRKVMLAFEMEVFAFSAELFNRDGAPELVAQVLQVAGSYVDGMERYALIPQLLGGDLAAALFMLDRTAGSEILFRPWGNKNHFGNETHKYLMLHYATRDYVANRLLGVEPKRESVDKDELRQDVTDDMIEKAFRREGYSRDLVRAKMKALEQKIEAADRANEELVFSGEEKKLLKLGRKLKKLDSSALTPDLRKKFKQPNGEIRLTGEDAVRRNLEKAGRYQSKEDFQSLYDGEAHITRYAELEAKDKAGMRMTADEVDILEFGRIYKKKKAKIRLKKWEREAYQRRLASKRNAVDLAIQFHSLTQQIAVRGDPSYICESGPPKHRGEKALARLPELDAKLAAGQGLSTYEANVRKLALIQRKVDSTGLRSLNHDEDSFYQTNIDVVRQKRGSKDILVERKEAHYVPKHKAKKVIQFADNWAKIEWSRRLKVTSWEQMSETQRRAAFADIKGFYDGSKWKQLTSEEKLRSILESKGDRTLDETGGGLINNKARITHSYRIRRGAENEADHEVPETLWDKFSQSERETEAAETWKRSQVENWIKLVYGKKLNIHTEAWRNLTHAQEEDRIAKIREQLVGMGVFEGRGSPNFDRPIEGAVWGDVSGDEREDLLQEAIFRKRKVVRAKNIDNLSNNGFRTKIVDGSGKEITWSFAVKQADGTIETVTKPVDVMTASQHPLGQFLGIDYIAQQNEIRNQILKQEITDEAREVLEGRMRWEDADPRTLLRIEVDPKLELKILGEGDSANLENRMRTMMFAKCHESFYGTKRIEEELREVFHDPNNVDNRIAWHWTNEHIGSKRVVNLAEFVSTYMNSLSRRMRSNIPYILQPITSMPEMFGVSQMGVMGIPMMIVGKEQLQTNFLQELVDPPELKSYGGAVAASVKIRDSKITHINEQGLPQEGTQEKPTNDADKWRDHAREFINVFGHPAWGAHKKHELDLEKVLRETFGRLEKECRLVVAAVRFARTAGEEMLVEREAMFSEDGRYILGRDTDSTKPPPVSGSRSMVNDIIYNHLLWIISDEGRQAYKTEIPFYSMINMTMVDWLIGKITL